MNYKSLANKGRYGDSELRNVAGRRSHVNPREADIIDLWGALGESLVQREGAGTRNPKTGMPEYWSLRPSKKAKKWWNDRVKPVGNMSLLDATVYVGSVGMIDTSNENMGSVANFSTFDKGITEGTFFGAETAKEKAKRARREQQDYEDSIGYDKTEFTWTDGEFDPTSEEFKQSVLSTGGYDHLNVGFGFEQGDAKFFDPPNLDELGFIDEQFDIDTASLGEDLRSATESYDIGRESASLQAGRNLAGSRQQGDIARSRSNMATSGTINAQQRTANKGIWQDYTQQQKTLSSQMTSAQSAFDIGTADADLTKRRGVSGFWEDLESDYYDMAGNLE